jgi:Rrf2 family protein
VGSVISISQKSQYALRGVFELAKRGGRSTTVSELAAAQAIPQRFLELIFNELRQAGLIKSYRGPQGGHVLARPASEITVGEILRLVEGPTNLVKCVSAGQDCPFVMACPFRETWDEAAKAMDAVFHRTTIQGLIDRQIAAAANPIPGYSI